MSLRTDLDAAIVTFQKNNTYDPQAILKLNQAVVAYAESLVGIAPAAVVVPLTDNSTGASGGNTIAAVTDVASAANAVATLSAKVDAILVSLKAAGLMASS